MSSDWLSYHLLQGFLQYFSGWLCGHHRGICYSEKSLQVWRGRLGEEHAQPEPGEGGSWLYSIHHCRPAGKTDNLMSHTNINNAIFRCWWWQVEEFLGVTSIVLTPRSFLDPALAGKRSPRPDCPGQCGGWGWQLWTTESSCLVSGTNNYNIASPPSHWLCYRGIWWWLQWGYPGVQGWWRLE